MDLDRRILESLESGVVWFDPDLVIVDANRAARAALELGDGPLNVPSADAGWQPADGGLEPMPIEQRPVWRAMKTGELARGIVVVKTPRGGDRWLRVNALPVETLGAGRGPGVVASCTDFTEERNALHSLQDSEQLFRLFGEYSLDLMWIADPRARKLLYINAAYERIWGRSPAPLFEDLGHWLDGIAPEDRQRVADSAQHPNAAGLYESEYRVIRPDGRVVWVRGRGFPLFDREGRMRYMAGFAEDVTLARRAEEEIRLLNVELEQRVAERTAELEAKHREMEAFTYSVSHDLKAPLRGIDGYSRLLESDHGDTLDEEGRFFVSMIRKAAGQMGELIDDLLAYSRIERGRPRLGPLDAAAVLETVLDGSLDEVAAAGIALTRAIEPGVMALGEREGLVLVLRNLVDNAIKFTAGRPGRSIEAGVRREDGAALLWVRDNGVGFDMRYHDRIFEIFQRLHRAEDYPGTGVGLAMVRKAVERMHGRVWAEGTPGVGAVFHVRLPLA